VLRDGVLPCVGDAAARAALCGGGLQWLPLGFETGGGHTGGHLPCAVGARVCLLASPPLPQHGEIGGFAHYPISNGVAALAPAIPVCVHVTSPWLSRATPHPLLTQNPAALPRPPPLRPPLLPDDEVDAAAKLLRLLHLRDLRELQGLVDEAIVSLQARDGVGATGCACVCVYCMCV
jgi:hypothetical protein